MLGSAKTSSTFALTLLMGCAPASPPRAPESAPFDQGGACKGPEYHQLDFWIGEWEVHDKAGKRDGTNTIAATLDHCAVEESYTDTRGHSGKSLFFYDRAIARWKQVWVTDDGTWKEKRQELDVSAPAMRFRGNLPRPRGGAVLDRTTLALLHDGRVRQVIEQSTDDGVTWHSWEGLYSRKKPAACSQRDFDFWVGDWDLVVRARKSADSEDWETARGVNRIALVLGGCAIEESFTAEGPTAPWAGRSLSIFVDSEKAWRQTWVDDSGGYLTFTGKLAKGEMVLRAEPRTKDGVTTQMRMVFYDLTDKHLSWRWEATRDGGATWKAMMQIEYTRRAS